MYKPCRAVDWYQYETNSTVPKTTTQDMLEEGCKKGTKMKVIEKKQLNFLSYSMSDSRTIDSYKSVGLTTSYNRDYAPPNDHGICPSKVDIETELDPVFNRKPPNVFGMRQTTDHKFMDDHFANIPESRKRVDFMRQIRNVHFKLI